MTDERAEKLAREAVEEARTVVPGIQALFGFQLIAVFNERFTRLPEAHRLQHLAAIVVIALAVAMITTRAAFHRQVEHGSASNFDLGAARRGPIAERKCGGDPEDSEGGLVSRRSYGCRHRGLPLVMLVGPLRGIGSLT